MTHHLKTGRCPTEQALDEHGQRAEPEESCRNGFSAKTVLGDSGEMDIEVPHDRHSSFEPLLVPKWQKKLPGFEDKIIALYARGMTVRDIKEMLEQQCRIKVTIAVSWRWAWEQVIPFFVYPAAVRKIIYTTNAIESLNMQLRKIIENRGHFPSDEAASKLLYLALRDIHTRWKSSSTTKGKLRQG